MLSDLVPAPPAHIESVAPSDTTQLPAPPADPMAAVLALLQEQKVAMSEHKLAMDEQKAAMNEQKAASERLEASQIRLERKQKAATNGHKLATECLEGQAKRHQ